MKERPIIMRACEVRAILEGRKTQTRRVVKPQGAVLTDSMARAFGIQPPPVQNQPVIQCPYGQPGDRLWVKETFRSAQQAGETIDWVYRASCPALTEYLFPWKPSIYMPRWASRITLEIVSVRVERLQDISDFDAYSEGACSKTGTITGPYCMSYVEGYRDLWESINGPRSWDSNPWVWVVEFKEVKP